MTTAITVENLSKRFILSHQRKERYTALRDVIATGVKRIAHKLTHPFVESENDSAHEEFWALRDISFDIEQGDRIGIIGRNGAGKSTLLKILSRITEPTSGRVSIHGRVASLLEVGTGFHPELTGRENIFLNGAILGMSKAEIKKKFDEIVAFAEVEKFLDTPVKRYSSGMYVRLAFAVAAHLEPEILVVDEVLAVGDAQFQKKCLGKMEDVGKEGRTVLFVSHNMAAIKYLCGKVIVLDSGKIRFYGNAENGIIEYLKMASEASMMNLKEREDRVGNGSIRLISFEIRDMESNAPLTNMISGGAYKLIFKYKKNGKDVNQKNLTLSVGIDDSYGNRISHLSNATTNQFLEVAGNEEGVIEIAIQNLPLCKGTYSLTLYATVGGEVADFIKNAVSIEVENGDYFHSGKTPTHGQGVFYMAHSFLNAVDGTV
jgi:lipopolysaccharide transport system ATP-binding protein